VSCGDFCSRAASAPRFAQYWGQWLGCTGSLGVLHPLSSLLLPFSILPATQRWYLKTSWRSASSVLERRRCVENFVGFFCIVVVSVKAFVINSQKLLVVMLEASDDRRTSASGR